MNQRRERLSLLVLPEVFVFHIPEKIRRENHNTYRARDWDINNPDWVGVLQLCTGPSSCVVQLGKDGNFGSGLIKSYPGKSLHPTLDSSRYFVLRLQMYSGEEGLVGMGFSSRDDSDQFKNKLKEYFTRSLPTNETNPRRQEQPHSSRPNRYEERRLIDRKEDSVKYSRPSSSTPVAFSRFLYFNCNNCTKAFKSSGRLRVHMLSCRPKEIQNGMIPRLQDSGTNGSKKPSSQSFVTFQSTPAAEDNEPAGQETFRKIYQCNQCSHTAKKKYMIKAHMVTEHGSEQFMCFICRDKFASNKSLKKHLNTNPDHLWFKCHVCSLTFTRKEFLSEHLKFHGQ